MVKVIRKIADILLIVIIVILAGYYVLRLANKVEIFSIVTGSMEEDIHVGDYVLIFKKNDYKVGEIVTYEKEDYYITHRVIRKDGNSYVTKGDANNTEDEEINKSSIIGKVILSGGLLNIIIRYKYVIAGVILTLYLASWMFKDLIEYIKDDENKEEVN